MFVCVCVSQERRWGEGEGQGEGEGEKWGDRESKKQMGKPAKLMIFYFGSFTAATTEKEGQREREKPLPTPALIETLILK